MSESTSDPARWWWTVVHWFLTTGFLATAVIGIQRIRAGFVSNYAADFFCPRQSVYPFNETPP